MRDLERELDETKRREKERKEKADKKLKNNRDLIKRLNKKLEKLEVSLVLSVLLAVGGQNLQQKIPHNSSHPTWQILHTRRKFIIRYHENVPH